MTATAWIGLLASCLSVAGFVPQVVKAWRTRSTADVSGGMFVLLATGCLAWIAYGWLRDDWAVVATNGIILVLTTTMIGLKVRYG